MESKVFEEWRKLMLYKREVKVYGFYIVIKIVPITMIKIIHAKGYRCLETALVFQLKNNILSIYICNAFSDV